MRFLWLALSIMFPLMLISILEGSDQSESAAVVSYGIVCLAEIVFIALCVAAFISDRNKQEYITHQKIRHDRDEDIKKWRKEFMQDSLNLYEMQDESLKRASDLAGRSEASTAPAHDFSKANDGAE